MVVDILTIVIVSVSLLIGYLIGHFLGTFRREKLWQEQLPGHRADAIARSRSVLAGNFSEQLAPYLPNFPFKPTECKFMGKPIDFIVFKGLDEKNVQEVVFVEVKRGKSIFTIKVNKEHLKSAAEAIRLAIPRLPAKCSVEIEKN